MSAPRCDRFGNCYPAAPREGPATPPPSLATGTGAYGYGAETAYGYGGGYSPASAAFAPLAAGGGGGGGIGGGGGGAPPPLAASSPEVVQAQLLAIAKELEPFLNPSGAPAGAAVTPTVTRLAENIIEAIPAFSAQRQQPVVIIRTCLQNPQLQSTLRESINDLFYRAAVQAAGTSGAFYGASTAGDILRAAGVGREAYPQILNLCGCSGGGAPAANIAAYLASAAGAARAPPPAPVQLPCTPVVLPDTKGSGTLVAGGNAATDVRTNLVNSLINGTQVPTRLSDVEARALSYLVARGVAVLRETRVGSTAGGYTLPRSPSLRDIESNETYSLLPPSGKYGVGDVAVTNRCGPTVYTGLGARTSSTQAIEELAGVFTRALNISAPTTCVSGASVGVALDGTDLVTVIRGFSQDDLRHALFAQEVCNASCKIKSDLLNMFNYDMKQASAAGNVLGRLLVRDPIWNGEDEPDLDWRDFLMSTPSLARGRDLFELAPEQRLLAEHFYLPERVPALGVAVEALRQQIASSLVRQSRNVINKLTERLTKVNAQLAAAPKDVYGRYITDPACTTVNVGELQVQKQRLEFAIPRAVEMSKFLTEFVGEGKLPPVTSIRVAWDSDVPPTVPPHSPEVKVTPPTITPEGAATGVKPEGGAAAVEQQGAYAYDPAINAALGGNKKPSPQDDLPAVVIELRRSLLDKSGGWSSGAPTLQYVSPKIIQYSLLAHEGTPLGSFATPLIVKTALVAATTAPPWRDLTAINFIPPIESNDAALINSVDGDLFLLAPNYAAVSPLDPALLAAVPNAGTNLDTVQLSSAATLTLNRLKATIENYNRFLAGGPSAAIVEAAQPLGLLRYEPTGLGPQPTRSRLAAGGSRSEYSQRHDMSSRRY